MCHSGGSNILRLQVNLVNKSNLQHSMMTAGRSGLKVDLAARVSKEPHVAAQERPLRPGRALAGTGKAKRTPSRSASPVSTRRGMWERGVEVDLAVRVRKELPVSAHERPARLARPGTRKIKPTPSRSPSPPAAQERACDNEPCDRRLPVFERARSHSASPPRQQRPPYAAAKESFPSSMSTTAPRLDVDDSATDRGCHHSELDSGGREGPEESENLLTSKSAKWRVAWDVHSRSAPLLSLFEARQMATIAKLVQPTTRPIGIRSVIRHISDPLPTESAPRREGDLAGIFGDELQDRLARKMKEVEAQRAADQEDTVKQKLRGFRRIVTTASPSSQSAAQGSHLLKLSPTTQVEPKFRVAQRRRSLISVGPGMDKCDRVKDALLRKVERQTNQCFREMFAGLPEEELDVEIHRVFYSFDSDGNRRLDKGELAHAFEVMGLRLSREQIDATFEELDHNGNGTIEAYEFCRMVRERE